MAGSLKTSGKFFMICKEVFPFFNVRINFNCFKIALKGLWQYCQNFFPRYGCSWMPIVQLFIHCEDSMLKTSFHPAGNYDDDTESVTGPYDFRSMLKKTNNEPPDFRGRQGSYGSPGGIIFLFGARQFFSGFQIQRCCPKTEGVPKRQLKALYHLIKI